MPRSRTSSSSRRFASFCRISSSDWEKLRPARSFLSALPPLSAAAACATFDDGADGSVTDLFGYGDIPGWIADVAEGGTYRLEMEFYKRKTLCEKALSIVARRLNPAAAAEPDPEK